MIASGVPAWRRATTERRATERGFTLVELLVVLAILGIIVALVTPAALHYLARAKTEAARIQVQSLSNALDLFRLDESRYPTEQEGLQALVAAPPGMTNWNGPYIKQKAVPMDPWGRPYRYKIPGEHGEYDLYTLGAANTPGGTGENQTVGNW